MEKLMIILLEKLIQLYNIYRTTVKLQEIDSNTYDIPMGNGIKLQIGIMQMDLTW